MLGRIYSSALLGVDACLVLVEADVGGSAAQNPFVIVGLPDAAVQEARERVSSAIRNSNFAFPTRRITINLAPADVRKEGPAFDLPIALAVLAATEQITVQARDDFLAVGELSLDGSVRGISGVLPVALRAREAGKPNLILPRANVAEATVVEGLRAYPVDSLIEAAEVLVHPENFAPAPSTPFDGDLARPTYLVDFSDVKGQAHVKRALEVAAAGGHNLVMAGPPGSGKTMLARRLPTILPRLELEEALEVTKVYSISGKLPSGASLISTRPFRDPHHTISAIGLAGGGAIPRPGEVSLAHHGVLFLDELPEFNRDALEVLRSPLEDGVVNISRAAGAASYPARVMLVAAMNPCPCGFFMDAQRTCTCTHGLIQRYLRRISGPLLDRIDIHLEVPRLRHDELMLGTDGEHSTAIRERVERAREVQRQRFAGTGNFCNAHMQSHQIREFCTLPADGVAFLRSVIEQLQLSARAYDRILKLSRTIADLDGAAGIALPHLAEAAQYRGLDRKLWG